MSRILEMIENEEVEWKSLGDKYVSLSINTGLNPRKNFKLNDSSDGELSCWYITTKDYSTNEKIEFLEGKTDKITENARKLINNRSKLEKDDILFSAVGTVGKIAIVNVEPYNFDVNESTFVIKPNKKNVLPQYLMYYLRSDFIQDEVKKSLKGSTLLGIRKDKVMDLKIPIPSLQTQEKIVKILDEFTGYITTLQTELDKRTKQYEYYRDLLLSEDYLNTKSLELCGEGSVVEWKSLGELACYSNQKISTNELNLNNYVGVDNLLKGKMGKTIANYFPKDTMVNKYHINDILIGNIRPYLRKIWHADNDGGANGDVLVIKLKDNLKDIINSRYLYHILSDERFFKYNIDCSRGAKMPRGDKEKIIKYPIPIPPIPVQEHIVLVLDKFDKLTNDIKQGLPSEIELRQKQYEYYRERLLSF